MLENEPVNICLQGMLCYTTELHLLTTYNNAWCDAHESWTKLWNANMFVKITRFCFPEILKCSPNLLQTLPSCSSFLLFSADALADFLLSSHLYHLSLSEIISAAWWGNDAHIANWICQLGSRLSCSNFPLCFFRVKAMHDLPLSSVNLIGYIMLSHNHCLQPPKNIFVCPATKNTEKVASIIKGRCKTFG